MHEGKRATEVEHWRKFELRVLAGAVGKPKSDDG